MLNDHVNVFGWTWSRMIPWVAERASAMVVGGTLTCKSPPPDRKPRCESHQDGLLDPAHDSPGFCSV